MTNSPSRNLIHELQAWYHAHCNGDWEHEYGIRLENLDNPGWSLSIPISDTELESREFVPSQWDHGLGDWVSCRVENRVFRGDGGSQNLADILRLFLDWAGSGEGKASGTGAGDR